MNVELEMLRAFYRSWVGFHKIPRDKLHRHKQEAAAQLMTDNAHTLQRYYEMNAVKEAEIVIERVGSSDDPA